MVFAYMGPPDARPPFPIYDSLSRPAYRRMPGIKYAYPCNWLQMMENAMDPAHTAFLHTIKWAAITPVPRDPEWAPRRRSEGSIWTPAAWRQRLGAGGRSNPAEPTTVGPGWEDGLEEHAFTGPILFRWIVPMDDTHTLRIEFLLASETEGITPSWLATLTP